jgi:hypothetical protein
VEVYVNRKQLSRVGSALIGATLLLAALVPAATAAPPKWTIAVDNLAPVVKPGNDAGFRVTITNLGPSNISALYLTSNQTFAPKYVSPNPWCATSGLLFCSFGALNAGAAVTIDVIAYTVPSNASKFDIVFQANTNGKTFSDKGGNSRGDTLDGTPVPSLTLNSNANFGGGYIVDNTAVSNSTSLGNRNIQSTQVTAPATLIPATVEDGITSDLCGDGLCDSGEQFGEWSRVSVAGGATFDSAFQITITVLGRTLPSPKPDAGTVLVYHTDDDGVPTIIGDIAAERCDSATAPTNVPADGCVTASYSGQNLVIVVWVYENGGFRGAA